MGGVVRAFQEQPPVMSCCDKAADTQQQVSSHRQPDEKGSGRATS